MANVIRSGAALRKGYAVSAGVAVGSFEELQQRLGLVCEWLQRLGLPVRQSRFGRYVDTVAALVATYDSQQPESRPYTPAQYLNAMYEANELWTLYKGMSAPQFDSYVLARAERFAKGPASYVDESATTSVGRNFAFELILAARFAAGGLPLDAASPADVATAFRGRTLLVECKRISSLAKIERNIRDAVEQLDSKLNTATRTRTRGIVALDISKIVNPDFGLLRCATNAALPELTIRPLEAFARDLPLTWISSRCPHAIAVIARYSLMARVGTPPVPTYCDRYVFVSAVPPKTLDNGVGAELVRALKLSD